MRAILLLALAVSVGGAAAAASPVKAPIPIHQPLPPTPEEAVGLGLEPTVAARVTVDVRGIPTRVEVKRIEPSTPHDAAFETATRTALSGWRYAPALSDGKPVEGSVDVTIRFLPSGARLPGPQDGPRPLMDPREEADSLVRFTRYLATLDEAARRRELEKLASEAEARLHRAERKEAGTDHFLVVTDHPKPGVAEAIAKNLEVVLGVTNDLLSGKILAQPSHRKILAYVFTSEGSYRSLVSQKPGLDKSAGFYSPVGLLAFHMEMVFNERLLQILLHEGVHAFVDRYVAKPGVLMPTWLGEGLAEYVGSSDVKKGKIVLGSHSRVRVYRNPYSLWRGRSDEATEAAEVRKAFRQGKAIPLTDLVSATWSEFYEERSHLYYTESWLLVHFLRHAKPSWATDEFPRFLLYVAEGYAPGDAFLTVYGAAFESYNDEFLRYIKRF